MKGKNIPNLNKRPQTGIGVMIIKNGKVLMHIRKNVDGHGEYAFPGGHVEHGESFSECARREVMEESGIKIKNIRFQFVANILKYNSNQVTHIGLIADWQSGKPKNLEPKKGSDWEWYPITKPPKPLFEACRLSFIAYKTGKSYFDP